MPIHMIRHTDIGPMKNTITSIAALECRPITALLHPLVTDLPAGNHITGSCPRPPNIVLLMIIGGMSKRQPNVTSDNGSFPALVILNCIPSGSDVSRVKLGSMVIRGRHAITSAITPKTTLETFHARVRFFTKRGRNSPWNKPGRNDCWRSIFSGLSSVSDFVTVVGRLRGGFERDIRSLIPRRQS